MPNVNRSDYLASKVMTASPPQLHLMLIEGAIRFCAKAQQELAKNNEGHANEAMVRAIDVVGELLAGVRQGDSDINAKLSELYLFLFHTLTSAYVNTDQVKLADVMRILEFERETWQLACERVHAEGSAAPSAAMQSSANEPPAAKPVAISPIVAPHVAAESPIEGLSIQA